MKVKTYKTRSLQEGLEDIKRDLGSDALIVSTRSITSRVPFNLFRKPTWEITAALEEKPAVPPAPAPALAPRTSPIGQIPLAEVAVKDRVSVSRTAPAATAAAAAPARVIQKDPRMDHLIGEIADLKNSLRSLSKAIPAKSAVGRLFAERLGH